jgi:hypothetical protein
MVKHCLFCCSLLLTAFVAGATTPGAPGTNGDSNISGTVVTGSAKPLKQVTVVVTSPCLLKPQAVETDENGNFNFGKMEPCTYKVTFETSGYKKVINAKVVVEGGKKTVPLKIELQPDCEWTETDHGTFSNQLQIYE